MSAFQPMRELLEGAAPLESFVRLLNRCPSCSDRKAAIMALREHGALTDDETGALITGLMLECD
jgi:hypothetical protein